MMMKIKNTPRFFTQELIDYVEKSKNAKYVFESCVKDKNDNWVNCPFAIFYCPEPHPVSNSHYFGLYFPYGKDGAYIVNGQSAIDVEYTGIVVDGEVYYSVFRHDYHSVESQNVAIDGGRDYSRIVGSPMVVNFKIVDGEFIINEQSEES